MAPKRQAPTVRLRRLAAELRRLRNAADLTREETSEKTGINNATLYRIETARARPQMRTLVALLNLYEVDQEQRRYLTDLCRDATRQGWLRPYHSELPEEYTAYISFEDEARSVRNYGSLIVPGLLQTEDYARALIRGGLPGATDDQVEDRVRARMQRRGVLTKSPPLKLWVVLDEAALRRVVGGVEVMRAQLDHLLDAAKAPNVTFQLIPFGAGSHPGMTGQFSFLDFSDPLDKELIFIDSMAGDLFLESDADIGRYRSVFEHLVAVALSPKQSAAVVAEVAGEL
ncbi:MAG: helix-turn-helix domain-containing protein [Actinophytocola sp.]|uniref:helix-turn-helix domain-containing protein n=1 Tax=Actinophytocola sp. TaxID=1872138 RepID=UPI001327A62F|nr:helix-turn-helix transcriptional regulator [Actinophytocola sp.]MPZ81403.1 helix-turn-helix domain-containing protein [Actinophytocola sp.]